jgi:hypothetical protein
MSADKLFFNPVFSFVFFLFLDIFIFYYFYTACSNSVYGVCSMTCQCTCAMCDNLKFIFFLVTAQNL